MNTLHLGRNPIFQAPQPGTTTSSPYSAASDQEQLIPINEALHSSLIKKIIQSRLRAMNRTNNSVMASSAEYMNPSRLPDTQLMSLPPQPEEQPEIQAMICQQAVTISLTIFGNLLMIFVILRNNYILRRKRITPVQMLMMNLCTSDLMFAILTIFPNLLMTLTLPNFYGPNMLCKVVKFLQVLPMYTSSFLLVAISADRFYAICRPLVNIRSGRYNRPVLYAAIAWISAFIFSMPQLVIFGKNESSNDCIAQFTDAWQYPVYVIVFNVVAWLLPSIIAGSLYFCVCRAVWRSMAFEKNCVTPTRGNSFTKTKVRSSSSYNNTEAEHQHLTATLTNATDRRDSRLSSVNTLVHHSGLRIQREELDRKRIQTVKLTLTIVTTNFVLWAPFNIISLIDAVFPYFLSPNLMTYIMLFGNLNSSLNPFIWFVFNGDMLRNAFAPWIDESRLQKSSVVDSTFGGFLPNINNGTSTPVPQHSPPKGRQSPKTRPLHKPESANLCNGHQHPNALASEACKSQQAGKRGTDISKFNNNNHRMHAYRSVPDASSPRHLNEEHQRLKGRATWCNF